MGLRVPRLIFLLVFLVNCILWSSSRYTQVSTPYRSSRISLAKRNANLDGQLNPLLNISTLADEDQCHPYAVPLNEQCSNVKEECSEPHTFLSIPYVQNYFCSDVPLRPAIFAGYLVWLLFLFSTLGISASDFFCPNLGTLAQLLGLDENVAGVTFLAFGNGSPDLFSTFSAMREDSGGLAVGELLGAAAFVTSCVVGSMCIIKPFKVDRAPFIRDVGFFTTAVILLMVVLWDSRIELWEARLLIGVYFVYVVVVVAGSWWERRRARRLQREDLMRDEYREEVIPDITIIQEPYHDDPSHPSLQVPGTGARGRAISAPGPPPRLGLELPPRPRTRDSSPHGNFSRTSSAHSHMPSFSLIGALEFRRVVSSLQEQAAGSRLSLFESPLSPYPGGHYDSPHYRRRHISSRSRSRTPLSDRDRDQWETALDSVPLEQRSPQILINDVNPAEDQQQSILIPPGTHTPPPSTVYPDTDTEVDTYLPPPKSQRVWRTFSQIYHVLFPTLHNFRSKSTLGMIAALFAAPAVLALTLTLPVVVTVRDGLSMPIEKPENVERLVDFEEEGVARTLIAEDEVEEEMHELQYNKWLMAVQCALGPLFCVAILFYGMVHEPWLLLAAGVTGTCIGTLVAVFGGEGDSRYAQLARCSMGFVVAVVWIMAIADEVVEVLQTFGLIFGLSDAIIGLTIFAMGNSLADLVANMSVAVFAPIMGFSACFGGPMLNILLGIGISGTYIISSTTNDHYSLEFNTTLFITSAGLLGFLIATLVFVPWNNYFLPRSWGVVLICAYVMLMVANVVVEVMTHASGSHSAS
ncbi:Sodium/calcium exchanger protein-domain-containing protein [Irpex rosettiformis]|uniref:Sodium/calcium exchanger protein-domain-containing protein n=1 Tax=Irpex rosettiformis TaxID=378272 RepID=A0ACB8TQ32_9APHY|nr:Sodium/calcium exchanger protein-domain-containing protein [Irpex rosettiformis]